MKKGKKTGNNKRPAIINGIRFEEKQLLFDRFACKNGVYSLRFAKTPVFKADVDLKVTADDEIEEECSISKHADISRLKYVFYDRSSQEMISIPDTVIKGRWLYFRAPELPKREYETESYKGVLAAIDDSHSTCYSFIYCRSTAVSDYNHLDNILTQQTVGETKEKEPLLETFYLTRLDKTLQIAIQRYSLGLRDFLEARVRSLSLKNGVFKLNIDLKEKEYHITRIYISLRSKTETVEYDFSFKEKTIGTSVLIDAVLDLKPLKLSQFYWDVKAFAVKDGENKEQQIELRNHDKWMHRILYLRQLHYDYPDGNIVYPYKTKSRNIALQFRKKTEHDSWKFICQEYFALFLYYVFGWYLKRRKIWMIYEKYSKSAQDNSYYFFKYCMEKLPEKERHRIYYVIDKQSPDYSYVSAYGK